MNVDAAINNLSSSLVAIARDDKGIVIKAWARTHTSSSPIQAEANAILWVAQLAKMERWDHIIVEGDAKACFDPLSSQGWAPI